MKINTSPLGARLDLRLAAYAAAGAAVAVAAAPSAQAVVVYSGPVSLTVPNTTAGIYLNLVTRATATSGSALPGYDFNPYASSGLLSFFFSGSNAGLSQNGSSYTVLSNFDYVGPLSTFITGSTATTMAGFRAGETGGYLGLRFLNEATSTVNYGWIQINTTGTTGFPATITGYAYENTGAALFAGAVPEPGTNAALALGALALGAMGVRRWKQSKQAA